MLSKRYLMIALVVSTAAIWMADVRAEGQKALEPGSKIDKVVVYPDRALITRDAKLGNLAKGIYEVTLRDLPLRLQDDSVRATSSDPDNLKIIGLDIKTYQLEKPPEDKIRILQEQLQGLEDNMRTIDDNLKLLQLERDYIHNAKDTFFKSAFQPVEPPKDGNKPPALPRISTREYDEMLKYYIDKLRANAEAIQSTELKQREARKKIEFVHNELSRIGANRQEMPQKKSVKVNLEVLKDGAYNLALAYINYGVNWQASHDLRIFYETKEMEITSYSVVFQNSGEDWLNAELSFSTAQPALQGWLPELPPVFAGFPSGPQFGWADNKAALKDYNYRNLASNTVTVQQATTTVENNDESAGKPQDGFIVGGSGGNKGLLNQYLPTDASGNYGSVIFRTPKRVDIVSDGAPHRTALWQEKFPIRFEYITTPKISPYVYLRALGANKLAWPILRGNINVFMGADFIGTSLTAPILPDEEFELTLSVDENIRVARKLEEKEEKGPGFLGSTKKVTYSFLIKLENYKKENATVTVVDQIPVSQTKDITVEFDKYSDKPVEEGKDGKLKWKFDLKPKEVKELTFTFSVYVPKDKEAVFSNAPVPVQAEQQRIRMQKK